MDGSGDFDLEAQNVVEGVAVVLVPNGRCGEHNQIATGGIPPFDPSMTSPGNSLYWDGYYGNSTVVVYPGQLIIDLIDVSAKKLVWRGMGSEAISPNNPDKLMSEANSTVSKLFKEYPVKRP